ncbi:MAG: hypothetical protein ACT4OV_11550 [Microthrixaceae bacterium]
MDRGGLTPPESGLAAWRGQLLLAVAGVAAIVAGVVHGAAIAAHSEHRAAVWVFLGTAVFQLAWGAAAVVHPRRWVAVVGVAGSAVLLAGWVLAKNRGLSFVDGLDVAEPMRFADGLAATLAATTILLGGAALLFRRLALPRLLAAVACVALVGVGVPGARAAVTHQHPSNATVETVAEPASAVPPRAFDPALPIDLGGVDGVSPQQQARAENLLAATLLGLPQWADPAYAETRGFRSIGDGSTGVEHYVNREFMANATILDPNQPESLVFDTTVTPKKLVAAMYMLPPGVTLDGVPDIGGALTQWHIHNNLCFTADDRVAGLTQGDGTCAPPLIKGPEQPMIHVWITQHPCGPFAALEGIGGGQIKDGEQVACDHLHGA